jgi:hypothetical protein
VEPRAALGASFWPALAGRVGVGLVVQAGPFVSVDSPAFEGQLREGSVEATARIRTEAHAIVLELQAGPALVLSGLDGHASANNASVHALRGDPAFDVSAVADLAVTRSISVGLAVGTSTFLRFQRYTLDGVRLLDEPPVVGLFGLRLSVGVD